MDKLSLILFCVVIGVCLVSKSHAEIVRGSGLNEVVRILGDPEAEITQGERSTLYCQGLRIFMSSGRVDRMRGSLEQAVAEHSRNPVAAENERHIDKPSGYAYSPTLPAHGLDIPVNAAIVSTNPMREQFYS